MKPQVTRGLCERCDGVQHYGCVLDPFAAGCLRPSERTLATRYATTRSGSGGTVPSHSNVACRYARSRIGSRSGAPAVALTAKHTACTPKRPPFVSPLIGPAPAARPPSPADSFPRRSVSWLQAARRVTTTPSHRGQPRCSHTGWPRRRGTGAFRVERNLNAVHRLGVPIHFGLLVPAPSLASDLLSIAAYRVSWHRRRSGFPRWSLVTVRPL